MNILVLITDEEVVEICTKPTRQTALQVVKVLDVGMALIVANHKILINFKIHKDLCHRSVGDHKWNL